MKAFLAAALFAATSSAALAVAAEPAVGPDPMTTAAPAPAEAPVDRTAVAAGMGPDSAGLTAGCDARSVASNAEVGQARRAYNAQCRRVESRPFATASPPASRRR